MKLTRIGSAGRTCGGHVWRGFSSTCTLAARPAAATDLVISSGLRRHSAASPADQPQAEAATTTTTTATTKPPARRRRATTRAATSSGDEQEEEEKAVSAPKNRRAADLGLGVVTRERCLLTVKRSAEWVLGLDVNTNSTGFTVLHAPTGEIAECGVIETKTIPDLFDKVAFMRQRLAATYAANGRNGATWVVGIEDYLKSFGGVQWRTTDIMKLACLNCLISYECWHVFFGLSRDQAGPSPPALGLIGSDDERGGPAPKDDDDEVEEDEADYLAYGTKRPFKVHPSQARTYFGIRKRSAEDKIKDLGFHRVKGLFPSDHPWIVKKTGRLSEKNYDVVDSFMVAHYTRKMGVEATLYNDPNLFREFEAAWMRRNSSTIRLLRSRGIQQLSSSAAATAAAIGSEGDADAEGTPASKKRAASAEKRRQQGAERRAEKEWREEVERQARAAFKKAIRVTADAALPAPSSLPRVLKVREVRRFELLWTDRGIGKGIWDGALYRPLPDEGYYSLGDVARAYHADQPKLDDGELPVLAVAEKDPQFPHFLRKPVDYRLVWSDAGTKCKKPVSVWMPIPPPGFIALGSVASPDRNKPSLDAVRCVHQSLVQVAALSDKPVWKDQGSGGNLDVAIYNITPSEHEAENALLPGCMIAIGHYGKPTSVVHCLDKRCLMPESDDAAAMLPVGAPSLLGQQRNMPAITEKTSCPKCQGKGSWGVFGGCDSSSVHVLCTCPMCCGKGVLRAGSALCQQCEGMGGLSPFGKCDISSLHYQPCQCSGTGLA